MTQDTKSSSPALVALAWLLVGIPLGWGIYRSGLNAVKLFQPSAPTATAPATHASLLQSVVIGALGMPRVRASQNHQH